MPLPPKHEKREQFGHVFHVWVERGKGHRQNTKNAAILAVFLVLAMAEGTEKNPNAKNAARIGCIFRVWVGGMSNHEKHGHFGCVSGAWNNKGNKRTQTRKMRPIWPHFSRLGGGKVGAIAFFVLGEPKPN